MATFILALLIVYAIIGILAFIGFSYASYKAKDFTKDTLKIGSVLSILWFGVLGAVVIEKATGKPLF